MGDYTLMEADLSQRATRKSSSRSGGQTSTSKFFGLNMSKPGCKRTGPTNGNLRASSGKHRIKRSGVMDAASNFFHTADSLKHKIGEAAHRHAAPMGAFVCRHRTLRNYELSSEQAVNLKSIMNRVVLLPSSPFLQLWDIVVFGGLIVTGLFEPCLLVFEQLNGSPSVIIGLFLSMMFMLDTVLHFFRAKKEATRDGVVLITYLPDLSRTYLHGMFTLDLLSAFPFVLLVFVDRDSMPLLVIRISFPMLRFVRLPRLMDHLQEVTAWSFSVLNIFEFLLISFLVLHWIACVWALLGTSGATSWLSVAKQNYVFLTRESITDSELYFLALYWSVTVLTSVGFGDITPQSWSEFVCATICMSIGGGVWAYVVGSVCGLASAIDKHRNAFESQMNDVAVICKERNLPKQLQERVRDFYKHAQFFMRMKMYHSTIHELSPALKGEVISWMYGSCFRRVWYFDVVEDDKKCARLLVEGMVPKLYAPEEYIEDTVDNTRALVFLRSGLAIRKNSLLAPGAVWGLDVILGSEEHEDIEELLDREPTRSINFVFVLKLSKHHIDHAASLTPQFARRLRKAHCRMLLWRGVIAASRAEQRLRAQKHDPQMQTHVSHWDRLGKLMGQVVHRDRLLLEDGGGLSPHHPAAKSACRRSERRQTVVDLPTNAGILDNGIKESDSNELELARAAATGHSREAEPQDWRLPKHRSPPQVHDLSSPSLPHKRKRAAASRNSRRSNEGELGNTIEVSICTSSSEASEDSSPSKGSSPSRGSSPSKESPVSDLLSSWRRDVKKSLDAQATELEEFQTEVQEDVAALGEEVEELARLMHQLLARLDAEEKY